MSVDPEQGTPPAGNSPNPAAEPAAPPQAEVDWEKRYTDTQAAFTRSQQEIAQMRRLFDGEDEEGFTALLDKYGYAVEPEEEPPEGEPGQAVDPRVEELVKWQAEQQQAQHAQTLREEWDGWADYVKTKAGDVGLTDWELKALQVDSVGKDGFPVGPDEAEQILKRYLTDREGWIESQRKQRPRAPHVPAGGQPATGGKDVADMSRQELERMMLERLQAESV